MSSKSSPFTSLTLKQFESPRTAQKYVTRITSEVTRRFGGKVNISINQLDEYVFQVELYGVFPQHIDLALL